MFKKNLSHKQPQLLGFSFILNKEKYKRLKNSSRGHFYRLIFCNIQEQGFSVLYSATYRKNEMQVVLKLYCDGD